jgi:RNA polymerase sigma-70 factor (ECF subfamily)
MHTVQLPVVLPAGLTSTGAPGESGQSSAHAGGGSCDVGTLLLRLADGDARAFTELYERTSHRVYGLVRRILVDADMSAETTQDVFLALWVGGAARFDPDKGSGMSWVMTLAHHRAVDKVRAEESHRARDVRWGLRNRGTDHDQVADAVVSNCEVDVLRSGLGTLSAVQREAIHLAYYGGMTYVEVADHLGVPVPTAKTRIRDGIKRLSSHLRDFT